MTVQMQQLDLVGYWLDAVNRLPPGHPDRLRYLTYAEQIIERSQAARQRPATVHTDARAAGTQPSSTPASST